MTDLNSAWSTFLGMSTSLETAQLGIIGALRTLATQAGKTGASFTGVNDQSVTLQTTFESSLLPSVENVIGSMRTAHATTHDLAQVIATDLKPAVDHGALSNTAYKNQLYDLAVQAGYTGPNKLAPLKAWFDRNAASTDAAKAAVDRYAGALAKIPSTVHTTIIAEASGSGQIAITGSGWALGPGEHPVPRRGRGVHPRRDRPDRRRRARHAVQGRTGGARPDGQRGGGGSPARPGPRVRRGRPRRAGRAGVRGSGPGGDHRGRASRAGDAHRG